MNYDKIKESLNFTLSSKRFEHTLGVVEVAENLAKHYKVDAEKAKIAALLHDCAKEYSKEEMFDFCEKNNLDIETLIENYNPIAHSFLGAEVAKTIYSIKDENVTDAIRYHTTGRPEMSMLEKIIYIADYIEPGRKDFTGCLFSLGHIRMLAFQDLNNTMSAILKNTVYYLKNNNQNGNKRIHQLTIDASQYYK